MVSTSQTPPIHFLAVSPMVLARTAVKLVFNIKHYVPKKTPAVRRASTSKEWEQNVEGKGTDEDSSGGERRPVKMAPKCPVVWKHL